jgi:hypothetical protein
MKRIATIGAIVTAFAVAPSVAAAGDNPAQAKTSVASHAVVVYVANTHRAHTAVLVQRVQVAQALRFSVLRAHLR